MGDNRPISSEILIPITSASSLQVDIHSIVGKKELGHSLRTGYFVEAKYLARKMAGFAIRILSSGGVFWKNDFGNRMQVRIDLESLTAAPVC